MTTFTSTVRTVYVKLTVISLQTEFDSANSDAKDFLGGTDMAEGVQRRIVSRKVS